VGRKRVLALAVLLSALLTVHLAMLGTASFAQTDPTPTPSDTSTDTVSPTPTDTVVSPSPTDTVSPSPTDTVSPSPTDTVSPSPTPSASASVSVSPSVSPSSTATSTTKTTTVTATSTSLLTNLDAVIEGQATATYGGARTTAKLLAILGTMEKSGIPKLENILTVDHPFPVAGLAYWVDDWHAYRCCPKPHLHQGLDLMADRGTPLIAVVDGTISNMVNDPLWSGIAVTITDRYATRYFYAHLNGFAAGIHIGQKVHIGDVLGYVGNTGDAAGGPTHLHFEIHPNGGVSAPPKPSVDQWLDSAQIRAIKLVKKLTGKTVNDKNLDLSLWKNKLFALAQHEIQSANVLAARQTAQAKKAKPGVDQQTLPYTLPVVLLALLAGAMLLIDRRGMPAFRLRRPRSRDEDVEEFDEKAEDEHILVILDELEQHVTV
jgi:cytoskeletal protein RodZ